MKYTYRPKGTCSTLMQVEVENGIVVDVQVTAGCSGNLQGIRALIKGMPVQEAIDRMSGIRCGRRSTSCPDQLAIALSKCVEEQ